MSSIRKAIRAVEKGQISEFRDIIRSHLYARALDEIETRRIAVGQEMFYESGESGSEAAFRILHSVEKMDEPYHHVNKDGDPNETPRAPKRRADSDEPGNPKLTD